MNLQSVKLLAYQYPAQNQPLGHQLFWIELERYGITPHQCYQDDLAHRPQLMQLLEQTELASTTGSIYLLIKSPQDLADDIPDLQRRLTALWSAHITPIVISAIGARTQPIPQMLLPDGDPIPQLILGDLSPAIRYPSQAWMQMGQALTVQQHGLQVQLGHARNRQQLQPPPGQAPYGYRRGKTSYLIDLRAAPVVKAFYEHFLLYGCLRSSVRFVGQTYGKKISVSTAKRWLTHPVYRGHLRYRQSDVILNTHPSLMTALEAAQIDRLLQRNQGFAPRSASAPRSLAGLVRCDGCDSTMTISQVTKPRQQKRYLYLRPQACPHQPRCSSLPYQTVLTQTIQVICDRLPQAIAELPLHQRPQSQETLQIIQQKNKLLEQVKELLAQGILDAESAQVRTYNLKRELAELHQQRVMVPPVNLTETTQAIAIPEFWQDLSETERQFYFREFIRTVYISRSDSDWQVRLAFVFDPPRSPIVKGS